MEMLLLAAAGIAMFFAVQAARRRAYPHRLMELGQALKLHAAARKHTDREGADELVRLAEDLALAQSLANGSDEGLQSQWHRLRPQLLHLTSESALQRVDLFHSDRRYAIQQAVYDLVARLDARAG